MSKTVVVTGFGPFGEHKINASWETVQCLPDTIYDYQIIKQEVPVSYENVQQLVPLLWETHSPSLVIHVGVSAQATEITLERQGYRQGYLKLDVDQKPLCTGEVCSAENNQDCIVTGINLEKICQNLKTSKLKPCISEDAGRYLCEFIYYMSLNINNEKCLFIHVPPLDKPYSKEEMAKCIEEIIKTAITHLNEKTCSAFK